VNFTCARKRGDCRDNRPVGTDGAYRRLQIKLRSPPSLVKIRGSEDDQMRQAQIAEIFPVAIGVVLGAV
jgi:hypothetical protein